MKKFSLTVLLLVFLSSLLNSQIQLAGVGYNGTYAVNTAGNYGRLHSLNFTINSAVGPPVQGPDNRIYFISGFTSGSGYSLAAIQPDGTGFTILMAFPFYTFSGICTGPDGKLYFTNNSHKLLRINTDGSGYTELATIQDCYQLVSDGTGWLFGLSLSGQLFKVQTDGTGYTILRSFDPFTEGSTVNRGIGLTIAANGRIFGAFESGGINNTGCLFSINKDGTAFQMHSTYGTPADGVSPSGSLAYQNGKVYIVTQNGGTYNSGAISSINMDGTSLTKLYDFLDPARPLIGDRQSTGLTPGNDGKLYGLTRYQGTNQASLYSITEDGLTLQILYNTSFSSLHHTYFYQFPPLLLSDNNTLLLFSNQNGNHEAGFLYSVEKNGANPTARFDFGFNPGGGSLYGSLAKDAFNNLYGFAQTGGTGGGGILYKHSATGASFTKLYEFGGTAARYPNGKPLLASDGFLYGVCSRGSYPANVFTGGVIYKIAPDGTGFSIIKQFNTQPGPSYPSGELIEGPGGELYGTTQSGASNLPVIYKINKDGSGFTILRSFITQQEGYMLIDGLTLSGNYLYGSCALGGNLGGGTLFRIQTDGTGFQLLRNLDPSGTGGYFPMGAMIMGSNGRLYGVNSFGGVNGNGTLFSMLPDGTGYTVHHQFNVAVSGNVVQGRLLQATDGRIYGATSTGGTTGGGSVFRINADGTGFTVVRSIGNTQTPPLGALIEIPFTPNLPVKLVNFRAMKVNNQSKLSWRTEEEAEFDHFLVERSTDGNLFTTTGRVDARGGTATITDYDFTDASPARGKNFYRLRIVNQDGSYQFSDVRLLDFNRDGNFIEVFPNPSGNRLLIRHNLQARFITIAVRDLAGRLLKQETRPNSTPTELDLGSLSSGIYTITLMGDGVVVSARAVKR